MLRLRWAFGLLAAFEFAAGCQRPALQGDSQRGAHRQEESAREQSVQPLLSLEVRPNVGADGEISLLMTLRNSGQSTAAIERHNLPWNMIDRRCIHLTRGSKEVHSFEISRERSQDQFITESLPPKGGITGHVELLGLTPGHHEIRGCVGCMMGFGNAGTKTCTLHLSFGPVEFDAPTNVASRFHQEQQGYEQSVSEARRLLHAGELDQALAACSQAEIHDITSTTRELRKAIMDAKRSEELIASGDKAMREQDYSRADETYFLAYRIAASELIERKQRLAHALLLYQHAIADLKKGDRMAAWRNLRSLAWNCSTPESERLLESTITYQAIPASQSGGDRGRSPR